MFPSGWTALMYAVNTANPEAVDALLKLGADANFHKGKNGTNLLTDLAVSEQC